MITEMAQMSATAKAHMNRDVEAGGKWVCDCEPCRELRSLVGMEKVFKVRPLVREIEQIEQRVSALPDGAEKRMLQAHYLTL